MTGTVLHLNRWRENFQLAFNRLNIVAIWVQLHHFSIVFRDSKALRVIGMQFGQLLKVDEHTVNLTLAKFARVCVELDLSQLLKRGSWVGFEDENVFVLALYEKLLVFCFSCGRVGHG